MGHYGHKNIPDAIFESGSSSSFGDMTSENFPWKKGTTYQAFALFFDCATIVTPQILLDFIFRNNVNLPTDLT